MYTSLDISVRYIRPGSIDGGELRAEGRVVHRGRKVRTAEATLTDEAGKLIATATSSLMVLPLGALTTTPPRTPWRFHWRPTGLPPNA